MHQKIISQIENVRKKNNRNWMNLLRIAFKYAPKVMKKINKCDMKVSSLVSRLSKINGK